MQADAAKIVRSSIEVTVSGVRRVRVVRTRREQRYCAANNVKNFVNSRFMMSGMHYRM